MMEVNPLSPKSMYIKVIQKLYSDFKTDLN